MAWIESHQSLSRHRKTLEAVALLHVDRHKFIGHLHELWWWGIDNASPGGQLGRVPPSALADAAGWPLKDAERFVDALVSSGFIERTEDGYVLHDWFDYSGKLSAMRAKNRTRMAAARAAREQRTNGAPNTARAENVQRTVQRTSGARAPATGQDSTEHKRTGPPGPPPPEKMHVQRTLCRDCGAAEVYAPEGLPLAEDESELDGLCPRCLIVAQQRLKAAARA